MPARPYLYMYWGTFGRAKTNELEQQTFVKFPRICITLLTVLASAKKGRSCVLVLELFWAHLPSFVLQYKGTPSGVQSIYKG